ncbi:MAG TPA: ABC transporter permease [Bryobacteraceae bacterium]|nr:ABC transporter permease [Bryobacteraceae bacterium]
MAWLSRVSNLLRGDRHREELDEELAAHIEMRARDNIVAGMSDEEALRDARLRFGNLTLEKERTREAAVVGWIDSLARDFRYTCDALRNSRGVAALIVVTLALGIGANTTIFTITNALILRSLPVRDPAQLLRIRLGNFSSWGYIEADDSLTYALWNQFDRGQDVLADYFACADTRLDAVLNGEVKQTTGAFATSPLFRTLGVDAILGRTFTDADERTPAQAAVVVISHGLWQREYASDPAVIGRTLLLEGKPFNIIGVLPERFFGMTVGRVADFYVPLAAEPYLRAADSALPNPTRYWLLVFGRLRPGITAQQAQSRLAALSAIAMRATLPSELPERARPRYLRQRFTLEPAHAGVSYVRSMAEQPLAVLSAITALLLLLACFTVANLLVARATARQKELAVRIALGASRWRIARQLALESSVLALAGAALGLVIARPFSAALLAAYPSPYGQLMLDLSPDWRVLGFAFLAAAVSAFVAGVGPALRAAQADPAELLKSGSTTAPASVLLFRRTLLAGQIAVAIVLVTAAVLFGGTLRNLMTAETGFNSDRVLLAEIDLRRSGIAKERRQQFYATLLDRMERIPSVDSAALSYVTPISGSTWQFNVRAETDSGPRSVHIYFHAVTPEFFRTFGTAVIAGRGFTPNDRAGAPAVALVNSTLARTVFGSTSPIGRRISVLDPEPLTFEIAGVVQDAKYRSLRQAVPPVLYTPIAQFAGAPASLSAALRSRGPVANIVHEVRRIFRDEYPSLSVRVGTFSAQINDSIGRERAVASLCTVFAALGLALAALGIFGVLSYLIARRRSEIGIRIALGARPADVRRLIYGQSFSTCAAGVAAGCVIAFWAARFTRTMLYGLTPTEPAVYLAAAGILSAVAVIATAVPARRASQTEPMTVLRSE